ERARSELDGESKQKKLHERHTEQHPERGAITNQLERFFESECSYSLECAHGLSSVIRPSLSLVVESHCAPSASSCEVSTTAVPRAASRRSSDHRERREVLSSAAVGSSRRSRAGCDNIAAAIIRRWRSPPDSLAARRDASASSANSFKTRATGAAG